MNTEMRNGVARENIRPEGLVSAEPFLKIFRNTYVGFYGGKVSPINLAVLYVESS